MLIWLKPGDPFPPAERALAYPAGLLAAGSDLSAATLLAAYRQGIFPWYSPGQPVLWWSPDPRMVLLPAAIKVSRSLRRRLARQDYEIRWNTSFREVMEACAAPRSGQDGTWINAAMIEAYERLFDLGHAHSVETWMDGELVGGLYGVAVGCAFFGESMFSRKSDASKLALVHLAKRLEAAGVGLIDCQMSTRHLASMGAREIPRAEFTRRLAELVDLPCRIV